MFEPILIIPLCGYGKRFKEAGYKKHKSLLKIDKFNMLERVIGKFPIKTSVYIITSLAIEKELKYNNFLQKKSEFNKIKFIIIDDHILGPAYSIFKAFDKLPKGLPTYISYCDITWSWNNLKFAIPKENVKAAIYCHYGFHPHLVNNNYSAFCLPSNDSQYDLLEIKEKDSYTLDWMNEPLSIGLFYVNDLNLFQQPLNNLIQDKKKVSNEYFPSLLFNYLVKSKIKVKLLPVKNFIHYGTPSQFEDFISWVNFFKKSINKIRFNNFYKAFIFTSGKGSRMKVISSKGKSLIKVGNQTLMEIILKFMPIKKSNLSIIFNNLKVPLSFLEKDTTYLKIKETSSQIESLFESKRYFDEIQNFFICSCDCFGLFNEKVFFDMTQSSIYDVICFGFNPSLLQINSRSNYSTLHYKDDFVDKIFVKNINNDSNFGLAGFFWIKNGNRFSFLLDQFFKLNNEFNREIIIDDLIEYFINLKLKVGMINLEKYCHLGTPEEFCEYKYWLENYETLLSLN
tara:strand:+ start:3970 stop:5502 length:1533 start_codon:yes stop_codon:yes gene_type:complete